MYNGYTNEQSYLFDVVWANDRPLNEAIKAYGASLLEGLPTMGNQTLGLNILHSLKAAIHDGGWGWRSKPDWYNNVPEKSLRDLSLTCGIMLDGIDETEFGENVRDALGMDFDPSDVVELDTNPKMHLLKADRVNEDEIEALESLISRLNGSALADFLRCITDGLRSGHDLTLIMGLKNNSDQLR